jgi:hypothetical protein
MIKVAVNNLESAPDDPSYSKPMPSTKIPVWGLPAL